MSITIWFVKNSRIYRDWRNKRVYIRKFFWRTSGSFEEGSKINNRAIKKEPKKALRNNIVKKSNPINIIHKKDNNMQENLRQKKQL